MQKKTLKIGITGGIGSGKSTVARIFSILGIPVYDADSRAKWLMIHDSVLVQGVQALFGEQAYLDDGSLNRGHIAQLAFSDADILKQLNALVHPAVHRDYEAWHASQKNVPYTLKEAALLFESGGAKAMDGVIEVFANQKIRIQRVMKRDGATRKQVLSRIQNQMPEREKRKLADFVIVNNGQSSLIQQIIALDKRLKK